jgi:hypothetical protein
MSEEILNEINEQVIENSEMLAEWFTQNLMPAIKSLKINPEKMFESKENIKASAESIFRILISNRYLTLAESGNFEKEEIKTYWAEDLFDVNGFCDLDLIYTVTQDQWDNESISKWRKEV